MKENIFRKLFTAAAVIGVINAALQAAIAYMESKRPSNDKTD